MTRSLAESLGPGHTAAQWATDFLNGIGAPASQQNVAAVVEWENAESGGGGGLYNPLNSVLGAPGASDVNSVGVKNYTSYQQGLAATIATFTQTQWANVVRGFKANDPDAAKQAIQAEYATWGGSINFPGTPNNATGVGGGNTAQLTDASGASGPAFYGCPEGKIWDGPSIAGQRIYLTKCQGRAILGFFCLVGGGALVALGLVFIAANSRAGALIPAANR